MSVCSAGKQELEIRLCSQATGRQDLTVRKCRKEKLIQFQLQELSMTPHGDEEDSACVPHLLSKIPWPVPRREDEDLSYCFSD